MAAPNIVSVTDIRGKSNVSNVSSGGSPIVGNASGSNKVFKVNALMVSNIDSANSILINVNFVRASANYSIARNMTVPYGATIEIISKSIYLEEGDSIHLQSSVNATAQSVCSYEEIS
jgi:hypothetical protein